MKKTRNELHIIAYACVWFDKNCIIIKWYYVNEYERNYEFPKKEPKKPFKYYTQYHELEAQIKGLKRKAKITGKKFEEVVKDWFEKNQHKHKLSKKEIEKIIGTQTIEITNNDTKNRYSPLDQLTQWASYVLFRCIFKIFTFYFSKKESNWVAFLPKWYLLSDDRRKKVQ